jgi:hypothetical protein
MHSRRTVCWALLVGVRVGRAGVGCWVRWDGRLVRGIVEPGEEDERDEDGGDYARGASEHCDGGPLDGKMVGGVVVMVGGSCSEVKQLREKVGKTKMRDGAGDEMKNRVVK